MSEPRDRSTEAYAGDEPDSDELAVARALGPLRDLVRATGPGRFFGNYELLGVVGAGGQGVVYRARQVHVGKVVALKLVNPADRDLALRELRLASDLEHPNLVRVYHVGEHDGQLYYTMQLAERGSLEENFEAYRPRLPGDHRGLAGLLGGVASAVAHLHRNGVVHRDLKPRNVLIDADGQPLVADLGLAWRLGEDCPGGGTVLYMAPEQMRGEPGQTGLADVYSLGVVLYRLLTGRLPFEGTAEEVRAKVLGPDRAPPPSSVDAGAGAGSDLELICMKCLEKHPTDRYRSAAALAEDLARAGEGERISLRGRDRGAEVAAAERKARLALETALSMAESIFALEPNLNPLRLEFLRVARNFYGELTRSLGTTPADRAKAADAFRRVAEIDRKLGQHDEAEKGVRQAVELARQLVREAPAEGQTAKTLARACQALARLCADTSREAEAEALFGESLEYADRALGEPDDDPAEETWASLAVEGCLDLGRLLHFQGQVARARRFYDRAAELSEALCERYPEDGYPVTAAAQCQYHVGICLDYLREGAEADRRYSRALDHVERLTEMAPSVLWEARLRSNVIRLGDLQGFNVGRRPEAEPLYFRAVAVFGRLVRRFPDVPALRNLLAIRRAILALYLQGRDRPAEAEQEFRAALALCAELCRGFPDLLEYLQGLAIGHELLGQFLHDQGRDGEADDHYARAVEVRRQIVARAPAVGRHGKELAAIERRLAALRGGGRPGEEIPRLWPWF